MVKNMSEKKIAITGMGLLTSLGYKKDDICKNLIAKNINITEKCWVKSDRKYSSFVHSIPPLHFTDINFDLKCLKSLEKVGNDINDDLTYLLAIIKMAIDDARLTYDSDNNEIGFILGNVYPGVEAFMKKIFDFLLDPDRQNKKFKDEINFETFYNLGVTEAFDLHTFMFLHNVGKIFNFHGFPLFVNNGCATGAYAIESASQMIKSGLAHTVIVATAEKSDFLKYMWFDSLQMYAKDGKIKPFAADRDGFIFGEGGGAFVLEDLEHARKRNANIYAEYLGGGFNFDGWKVVVPPLAGDSYYKAICNAIKRCEITPDKIELVVPHGAGTQISDNFESKMITKMFDLKDARPQITALKPYIGYNISGNVIMETGIMLLALKDKILPPILNCEITDPKLKIKNNLVKELQSTKINTFMKTDWGFGGFNSAMIFKVNK